MAVSIEEQEFLRWFKKLDIVSDRNILAILKAEGFYKIRHLKDFEIDQDLPSLPLKKAEKRRFVSGLKELEINEWRFPSNDAEIIVSDENDVGGTKEPEFDLGGVKMTMQLRKKFEKANVIIPNPRTDKHKFFNSLFCKLFKACYVHLQTRFVDYFKSERKSRWEFSCAMKSIQHAYEVIVNTPTGKTGGCDAKRYFSLPSKFDKHDASIVQNAMTELLTQSDLVFEQKEILKKDRKERLMLENSIVKKWASVEQEPYNREAMIECDRLSVTIKTASDKLSATLSHMKQKDQGCNIVSGEEQRKKRRKKENEHHSKNRKRQRIEQLCLNVVRRLGAPIVWDNLYSPSVTGSFQLSDNDINLDNLKGLTKNSLLLEVFNKLKGDLLEETGWEALMHWYDSYESD